MASNHELVTYLSLTPEFGGTRFGPFEGMEIRLGANAERCHIVLPASLGVLPEHVKLLRQGPANLILAPSDRTASVFLYKQGERRPTQLSTSTAVRPGDAFALVTPDGPRFVIELGELPPEIKAARAAERAPRTGRRRLTAESMKQEGIRQIWTRVLTFGPAQMAQRAWVYIASGAIWQPRNIFLFFAIASGWIFGSAMGCRTKGLRSENFAIQQKATNCEASVSALEQLRDKGIADYNFADLAVGISNSTILHTALQQDVELRKRVEAEARALNGRIEDYRWLIAARSTQRDDLARWRGQLLQPNSGIDRDTAQILTWAMAEPGMNRDPFRKVTDSRGEEVCGRGSFLSLTYRQARHLGLDAQPDGFTISSSPALESDDTAKRAVIAPVYARYFPDTPLEEGGTFLIEPLSGNVGHCVYREGDDDRDKAPDLIGGLRSAIGAKGGRLPPENAPHSSVARVAKLFAADIYNSRYTEKNMGIDFSGADVSTALGDKELGTGGQWALDRTAEAIAKSIVLPCLVLLENKDPGQVESLLGAPDQQRPSDLMCLILNYRLQKANEAE